jgi:hypothetical protein
LVALTIFRHGRVQPDQRAGAPLIYSAVGGSIINGMCKLLTPTTNVPVRFNAGGPPDRRRKSHQRLSL